MNKEEKEVVNMIKTGLEVSVEGQIIEQIHISRKEAKALLNLIQKQEALIDKMAEDIEKHMSEDVYNFLYICDKCKSNNEECHGDYCTETIKEYYKKVVDEDVKD